jgi:hypothetical protein
MRSLLILQRQLWLLLMVLLSMITARSPLEMLASSVRAIQQLARDTSENSEFTTTAVTPYVNNEQKPTTRPRHALPPAFILLSPVWESSEASTSNNRRQDMDFAESKTGNSGKVQQIMLTWPAELALPSRKIPLRFIATMAVPISTLSTDPLLTKGEINEVVYYSNMDLRKINITDKDKFILHPPSINIYDKESSHEEEEDSGENYDEETGVPPFLTTIPAVVRETTVSSTPSTPPTSDIPTLIPAVVISDLPVRNTDEERQRRSWSNEGSSSRAIAREHDFMLDWMDGESVAYIAVGTCCGLSVLTLAIVLLVLRLRGGPHRRGHIPPTLSTDSENNKHHHTRQGDNSSIDSYSSGDSNSVRLPEKLLNLLNSHSQEVSTHKLGSWFNGRPSTLSMRHGTNMAFPAPVRRFQVSEEPAEVHETIVVTDDVAIDASSDFAIEEADDETSCSDAQCDRGNTTSMEGTIEASETRDVESVASKHDTFIFWSTNSDRLV